MFLNAKLLLISLSSLSFDNHAATVSFSWNSELSVLQDSPTPFDEDRFRFHSFEDFQANCDRKGDLYNVGQMKLVNGQSLIGNPLLDEVEIASARHVLVVGKT